MTDPTRLAGTYGSDIDPLDDMQVEDVYPDIDFDFNDEPYLWNDEIEDVTEDFPF